MWAPGQGSSCEGLAGLDVARGESGLGVRVRVEAWDMTEHVRTLDKTPRG